MVHNFSAGPAILPQEVIKEAADGILNINGSGLSIMEVSHRGKEFGPIMEEAQSLVKEVLSLPTNYHVLFVGGGASSQFYMVPFNLLNKNETACYLNTGTWAKKAIKEANLFGNTQVVGTSENENFNHIPKSFKMPDAYRYFHITSNNTIFGTQIQDFPKVDRTLVCDMSSDIFSRPIEATDFGLIYAGAQKNLGPAGATLVIVNENELGRVSHDIPTMVDYRTHIAKGSMFNTPPVFPVYVCMLTLRWIKKLGGLDAMKIRNEAKAKLIYDAIDSLDAFVGTAHKEDRSLMNVTFRLNDVSKQDELFEYFTQNAVVGIKGHRSVGGFRASIYNAMELESVQHLVNLMEDFDSRL